MKKLITTILFIATTCLASAQARYTADYYKADPAKYLNKVVTVKIDSAQPSSFEAVKGYVSYHCWTAYNGERGGYIYVLVPSKKSKAFLRDYKEPKSKIKVDGYAKSATRDLRAKFRSTSKIVEWEKKKRAKRIKNVLQCPMC